MLQINANLDKNKSQRMSEGKGQETSNQQPETEKNSIILSANISPT